MTETDSPVTHIRTHVQRRRARTWRLPPRWTPTLSQLTLAMVVLGLAWRTLRYALGFPIWGDEAFVAVNFVARDFRGLIGPLLYGQIAPLGFMWAELALSRLLGLSEWALRLLPSLAGVTSLLLFWRFSQAVLPRRAALLAIAIFAAAYYAVRHAAEVKPYATDLLVSLLLTMLGWAVLQRPRSPIRWITLILFAGIAVWCSYPAAFVAGSVGLVLTWRLREGLGARELLGWLAFGAVVCGSFLAMFLIYAKPHAEAAARLTEIPMWVLAFPPLREPWNLVKWLFAIHTGEMFAYPHGGKPPGCIATTILVVIGAMHLWRRRGRPTGTSAATGALGAVHLWRRRGSPGRVPARRDGDCNRELLLLLLGPLPLTFIAAALKTYPYGGSARTSLYMAPAFCLLAGLGLFVTLKRFLRGRDLRAGLLVSVAVIAALPIGGIVGDVWKPYQSPASHRSRDAVLTVARQTSSGDRWVIFNADRQVPYAPFLGDWRGVGGQFVFDVLRFAPVPVAWAPPAGSLARPPGKCVWLLVYRAESRKVTFPQEQWQAYLDAATARLGPFRHQSFSIKNEKDKVESLEVYQFGASE